MRTLGDFRNATKDLPDDLVMVVAGEDSWNAEVDDGLVVKGTTKRVMTEEEAMRTTTDLEKFLYVEPRP
jgi:hypothetical protein